ncbi:MAG: class I SAM-dependent methyltransferase, partial [Candidatus Omnitrophica bacterium]|nr:class I SAM-dependent methyltransferase [Candidatus Omnitrophota bacterium]
MINCFKQKYARYYDLIYKDKNYEEECDYLEEIFKKFLKRRPKTILDLACGTGGHAIPLSKRGYRVTGIDISEPMIKIAQEKARKEKLNIKFYQSKMQEFKLNKKFDCAIAMFSAIDYLTDYFELKRALENISQHLKKDGLFIFDFWNGFAVLDHYSPQRIKIIQDKKIKIKRIAKTKIDTIK